MVRWVSLVVDGLHVVGWASSVAVVGWASLVVAGIPAVA